MGKVHYFVLVVPERASGEVGEVEKDGDHRSSATLSDVEVLEIRMSKCPGFQGGGCAGSE
ncbi:hypothetical protein [Georgenia sp. SUBG003]|uniref:hypothetical protein n=1 Tax=Georgenia sp. SUBG003 TaxID=1497974 RepID=UPI0004D7B1EF|nr:hypothetical protein DA06_25855 [Georgenia sp. SUBG003]